MSSMKRTRSAPLDERRSRRESSDSLDFRDVAVWSVEDALETAYRAGLAAAKEEQR
jgi:hypothetical protein